MHIFSTLDSFFNNEFNFPDISIVVWSCCYSHLCNDTNCLGVDPLENSIPFRCLASRNSHKRKLIMVWMSALDVHFSEWTMASKTSETWPWEGLTIHYRSFNIHFYMDTCWISQSFHIKSSKDFSEKKLSAQAVFNIWNDFFLLPYTLPCWLNCLILQDSRVILSVKSYLLEQPPIPLLCRVRYLFHIAQGKMELKACLFGCKNIVDIHP